MQAAVQEAICQNGRGTVHLEEIVIDSVLNLLFRCSHRRLTRPVTPVSRAGQPHGETYVVCLDCGKQFSYDVREMRIGKPLESSADRGVLRPDMPKPSNDKMKYALFASAVALFAGAMLKGGKRKPRAEQPRPETPEKTTSERLP
jgi:hypothetical protein